MSKRYSKLEEQIGYRFKDSEILKCALTHASFRASTDDKQDNNERLEFLGDRVLGLVIAKYLFLHDQAYDVGDMAQHLSFLVSRYLCGEITEKLNLLSYASMSKGVSVKPEVNLAVHANLCEALIGALYLDGGLDVARSFIHEFWGEWLEGDLSDDLTRSSKNELQEVVQGLGKPIPIYKVISRSGPDHAPIFLVEVEVETLGKAQGEGSSHQMAEKIAAQKLLAQMQKIR